MRSEPGLQKKGQDLLFCVNLETASHFRSYKWFCPVSRAEPCCGALIADGRGQGRTVGDDSPYWTCWMPATTQPPWPARGLTMCQISSIGSAGPFCSSRIKPLKRTLTM